jgi:hypothetical protein
MFPGRAGDEMDGIHASQRSDPRVERILLRGGIRSRDHAPQYSN